ncbi:hypothetical protein CRG98_043562 [Punica granatum]|uniref:Uncharacterized protein n=1 Tax=Punica granatum TaxID=22663 RepID=A0A2I0HWI8_PUNGR|nr:hypothetical protein CRG98_043562 [Punica granatum]
MRAPKCNAAWECPPSRGRVTDAREKESPLPVYDPKVEGRGSFGRIGLLRDWAETGRVGLDWAKLSAGPKWAEIRAGLGRIGPDWTSTGLGRIGLNWAVLLGAGRAAGRARAGPLGARTGWLFTKVWTQLAKKNGEKGKKLSGRPCGCIDSGRSRGAAGVYEGRLERESVGPRKSRASDFRG